MMKITTNRVKIAMSALSILLLFLIIVSFQNNTTMMITMSSPTQARLNAAIYYAGADHVYTEKGLIKASKVENNTYYFDLPNDTHYIRLDPTTSQADISIEQITVEQSDYFKKNISLLPTDSLKPLNQIENYEKVSKTIKFTSIGDDPSLDASLALTQVSTMIDMHWDIFLPLLLFFTISIYLYTLYKTNEFNGALSAKIILYSLFFALALFKVDYYKDTVKFGYPPDELAHVSYVDYVNKNDKIMPLFEDMRMLNNKTMGNYLGHPPLHYIMMGWVVDQNLSITNSENIDRLRIFNMIIFVTSFLLLLYIGFSSHMGLLGHLVYLTVISSIPMYAYLGGSISNDNLAILGGVIFAIGLMRLLEEKYTILTYSILGMGIFVAYFSKLTAAILIFFALVMFLIYVIKSKKEFKINWAQIIMLILFLLPIVYYQFYILINYHSLLPAFNVTYPEQYINSVFFIPENYRHYLTPTEWFMRMKLYIVEGWFGIHSHHSLIKSSFIDYIGLLILHIMAIVALFFKCQNDSKAYCLVGKIGLVSLFFALMVQYIISYQNHLNSGYMGGLQPRYFLPFMFSFAILVSIFVDRFKTIFLFNIFIILVCINALYSDFFYFLKYYIK